MLFRSDCKHGRQKVKYDHAKLEPILANTYGVFVYQEQVMAAAHDLAGFSMAQADELRRAMGKKIVEEMEKKRIQFVEGCEKTSRIAPKVAERIFATMEKFAGYGFNKSHSAAYAIVAYQCAFLKGNYPAEFMAAALTSEIKTLAHPASVDTIPTSANKEDHVSMSMHAGLKAERALQLATGVIAVEVLCACQAIDLRAPLKSSDPLMRAHAAVRARVPMLVDDRPPAPDLREISILIASGELEYATGNVVN